MDRHGMLAALRELYRGEALFRPSSIGRLLACPGSVQLIARSPPARPSSRFAQEGTAAHIVFAEALLGRRQPDEWADRMVRFDDAGMEGWFVDAEMVESVQSAVGEISARWEPDIEQYIEHPLTLGTLDPTDPIYAENRGTGDCILIYRRRRKITIADLKYGKGVMVAGDAPQLKDYATLAMINFADGRPWKEVETLVLQPRALREDERVKSVLHDPADLLDGFLGQLSEAMHRSLEPDPPLVAGKHCKWCRAAGNCPALRDEALRIGRDAFEPSLAARSSTMLGPLPDSVYVGTVQDPKPGVVSSTQVVLPPAALMGPDDVATVLERRGLWDTWIESVEVRAAALIEAGITVPGWMMSPRTGNRKFKGEPPAVVDELRKLGLSIGDMFEEAKLKSPAQMEKLLPKERRGLIEPLVERPVSAPVLMRVKEGRPAVAPRLGAIETG